MRDLSQLKLRLSDKLFPLFYYLVHRLRCYSKKLTFYYRDITNLSEGRKESGQGFICTLCGMTYQEEELKK